MIWHKGPFKLFVDSQDNENIQTADGQIVARFLNIGHEPEDTEAADKETDVFRASIIDALNKSAPAPLSAVTTGEWRSIESAPKDWNKILAFDPMEGRGVAICHIEKSTGHWYPSDEAEKFDGFFQPTHWMPLPQPPNSTTISPPAPLSSEAVGKVDE